MNKCVIRKCAELSKAAYGTEIDLENVKQIEDKQTDTQVYIGDTERYIYITCRGTSNVKDAIQDIKIWRRKCKFLANTKIHSGFLEQYESVRTEIINEVTKRIKDNNKKIVCSGHSLGSTVSTICALDLKLQFKEQHISCITFASPRVGNSSFAKLFNESIDISHRFVFFRDPITFSPFCIRYRHVKGCIHFKMDGTTEITETYFFPIGCLISQHYMSKYVEAIDKWLVSLDVSECYKVI